ncbi:MAG: hypothetical protein DMG97_00240 [Acidobacteria bacterium]|nr:MAG: hypothetical protein DMG97_00240 [Acidobacteriota bacterium]
MRNYRAALLAAGILAFVSAISAPSHGADARKSVVLTLTDGHRQSFPLADISGIEFKDAAIKLPVLNLVLWAATTHSSDAITFLVNGKLATEQDRISSLPSNRMAKRARLSDRATEPGQWLMERRAFRGTTAGMTLSARPAPGMRRLRSHQANHSLTIPIMWPTRGIRLPSRSNTRNRQQPAVPSECVDKVYTEM